MANSSSSSAEVMPRQTTNEETQARYAMVAAKSRWEEQEFFLDESLVNYGLEPIIYRRLSELGWFRFAQQPARANLNWVLEFYTNNAGGEDNTTVRSRRVAASSTTINGYSACPTMTLASMHCSEDLKTKTMRPSRTSSVSPAPNGTQRAETLTSSPAYTSSPKQNYGTHS
ncbi:hypothetical protein V6N12_024284 [Hibiscus sabdariffa]|uniref:Uncharacterized protein n=1 Tax=Hibiscus sabdariffa TaxID=183260 RepID=A0ABR2G043_9ROSI